MTADLHSWTVREPFGRDWAPQRVWRDLGQAAPDGPLEVVDEGGRRTPAQADAGGRRVHFVAGLAAGAAPRYQLAMATAPALDLARIAGAAVRFEGRAGGAELDASAGPATRTGLRGADGQWRPVAAAWDGVDVVAAPCALLASGPVFATAQLAALPSLRRSFAFLAATQAPVDARCGHRLLPTIGHVTVHHWCQGLQAYFAWAARATAPTDPAFAARMMAAWKRGGAFAVPLHDYFHDRIWSPPRGGRLTAHAFADGVDYLCGECRVRSLSFHGEWPRRRTRPSARGRPGAGGRADLAPAPGLRARPRGARPARRDRGRPADGLEPAGLRRQRADGGPQGPLSRPARRGPGRPRPAPAGAAPGAERFRPRRVRRAAAAILVVARGALDGATGHGDVGHGGA